MTAILPTDGGLYNIVLRWVYETTILMATPIQLPRCLGYSGAVRYSCRRDCSFKPHDLLTQSGFLVPMLNADGASH